METKRNEVREQVAGFIEEAVLNGAFSETNSQSLKNTRRLASQILAIPEIKAGLEAMEKGFNAKVDRDAKLPEIPTFLYDGYEDGLRLLLRRGAVNYSKMLTGWVKEVK